MVSRPIALSLPHFCPPSPHTSFNLQLPTNLSSISSVVYHSPPLNCSFSVLSVLSVLLKPSIGNMASVPSGVDPERGTYYPGGVSPTGAPQIAPQPGFSNSMDRDVSPGRPMNGTNTAADGGFQRDIRFNEKDLENGDPAREKSRQGSRRFSGQGRRGSQYYANLDDDQLDEYTALQKFISTYRDPKQAALEDAAHANAEDVGKKRPWVSTRLSCFVSFTFN